MVFITLILDLEKMMNNEIEKIINNTQLLGQERSKMTVKNLKINLKIQVKRQCHDELNTEISIY